jgi:hypothetical protein
MPHLLQVGVEAALGLDVGMADMMPRLGRFSAMIAYLGHARILQGGKGWPRRDMRRGSIPGERFSYSLPRQMASVFALFFPFEGRAGKKIFPFPPPALTSLTNHGYYSPSAR